MWIHYKKLIDVITKYEVIKKNFKLGLSLSLRQMFNAKI
jgi:hypothetical protein